MGAYQSADIVSESTGKLRFARATRRGRGETWLVGGTFLDFRMPGNGRIGVFLERSMLRSYMVTPRGVQRAEGPLRFFIIPQEWGTKGVDETWTDMRLPRLLLARRGGWLAMTGTEKRKGGSRWNWV